MKYMSTYVDIEKCEFVDAINFEVNIFNRGLFENLDAITENLEDAEKQLDTEIEHFLITK